MSSTTIQSRETVFTDPYMRTLVPAKHTLKRSFYQIQKSQSQASKSSVQQQSGSQNTSSLTQSTLIFEDGGRKKFTPSTSFDAPQNTSIAKREKAPGVYNTEALRRGNEPKKPPTNLSQSMITVGSSTQPTGPSPQKIRTFFTSNAATTNPLVQKDTAKESQQTPAKPFTPASNRPISSYLSSKNITRTLQTSSNQHNPQDLYHELNAKFSNRTNNSITTATQRGGSGSARGVFNNSSCSNIRSSNNHNNPPTFQPVISENPIFNKAPAPARHRNIHVNRVGSSGSASFYMQ